jgi:hypothetical protein
MPKYKIHHGNGNYGIVEARDIRQARREVRDEYGRQADVGELASEEELEWFDSMGGVPLRAERK